MGRGSPSSRKTIQNIQQGLKNVIKLHYRLQLQCDKLKKLKGHCRSTCLTSFLLSPYKDDLSEKSLRMRSVLYLEEIIGITFIAFYISILIWLLKDPNGSSDWSSNNNDNKVETCCEMDTVRSFPKWSCVGLNLYRLSVLREHMEKGSVSLLETGIMWVCVPWCVCFFCMYVSDFRLAQGLLEF